MYSTFFIVSADNNIELKGDYNWHLISMSLIYDLILSKNDKLFIECIRVQISAKIFILFVFLVGQVFMKQLAMSFRYP